MLNMFYRVIVSLLLQKIVMKRPTHHSLCGPHNVMKSWERCRRGNVPRSLIVCFVWWMCFIIYVQLNICTCWCLLNFIFLNFPIACLVNSQVSGWLVPLCGRIRYKVPFRKTHGGWWCFCWQKYKHEERDEDVSAVERWCVCCSSNL